MDLFCMKICKTNKVATHTSVASSFGLFDIEKGEFKYDKLALLGIDKSFLPDVTADSVIIGKCKEIPVSVPLGDNQASFLGSVSDNRESLLVNIGTGSQVSAVTDYCEASGDIELRPFIEGKYLVCGSALCGGYAYSMVESFFRSYLVSAGAPEEPQYKIMNELALKAYAKGEAALDVDVCFFGKRSDPNKRGSIKNIGRQNFTPESLILGTLSGMCGELYELYEERPQDSDHCRFYHFDDKLPDRSCIPGDETRLLVQVHCRICTDDDRHILYGRTHTCIHGIPRRICHGHQCAGHEPAACSGRREDKF
jgi:sedoheptulokinase